MRPFGALHLGICNYRNFNYLINVCHYYFCLDLPYQVFHGMPSPLVVVNIAEANRRIFHVRAFFLFCGSCYRQSSGSSVYVIRLIHIPLHPDQRLYVHHEENRGVLQPQGRQGTNLRRYEQRIRMGQAAEVVHGREHRVPAADGNHTKLLQVPHGEA